MADYAIEAESRTITGKKVKTLRNKGFVPVTVYGPKIEPVNLQMPYRPLELTLMAAGGTGLIDVNVGDEQYIVLTRDVQRDVLKRTILHVDFFAVDENTVIRAEIPIHLIGESPAVEARIGILLTGSNTLTIETLPGKLMRVIELDLTVLEEIGDAISVSDIDLGDDIVVINSPSETLARVVQPSAARAEEDLEEGEEGEEGEELEEGAEPEVISKGKGEEEEEV